MFSFAFGSSASFDKALAIVRQYCLGVQIDTYRDNHGYVIEVNSTDDNLFNLINSRISREI